MYLHYCLMAVGTIFVLSFILFYIMKKNNQVNRKNNANLAISTVLSMICAITIPLLAKQLVKGLSFSLAISMIISSIVLIAAAILIIVFLQPAIAKWSLKETFGNEENKDSLVEQIIESSSQPSPATEAEAYQETPIAEIAVSSAINEAAIAGENDNIPINSPTEIEKPQLQALRDDDYAISDIMQLLENAIELKSQRDFSGAISSYEAALIMNPEDELKFLLLLDLCALYKKTNQPENVSKILNSTRCELLDLEKKEEILRNLKIN